MKKLFVCSLLFFSNVFLVAAPSDSDSDSDVSADAAINTDQSAESSADTKNNDEFIELSEPERTVSGAYFGIGAGWSRISHKLQNVKSGPVRSADDKKEDIPGFSRSANQYDVSLIAGFGAPFYGNCYAGIEFSIFKRLGERNYRPKDTEIGLKHPSIIGMDMDVRLGYLFPESGNLIYATIGFARALGRVTFLKNNQGDTDEVSFGSFYPTFGFGVEHKMNHNWNIRGDFRISLTSADDRKLYRTKEQESKFDAKPSRCAFRISVTRNI
ncbi:hypothetical protein FACS189472_02560 [Alphaproteobacteria bacterium]|nr:hypothetical protein FACS189472_02560 [Alphaproteobacteria bacterium]